MNVLFFLKKRTDFIRQMYQVTSMPYIERLRKIENNEDPFSIEGEFDGENEFPYELEYAEATESLGTLRLIYISMIMSALHSYLKTWVKQSRKDFDRNLKVSNNTKKGWFWNYNRHFIHYFDIDFNRSPVNLKIIEEIILARNNIEHQSSIGSAPRYTQQDYETLESFLYIDDFSNYYLQEIGFNLMTAPGIKVSKEQLLLSISIIEEFSEWFNKEIESKIYPKSGNTEKAT